MLTLSIIIPVYNEEHHIIDCLESIKLQSVKPDEVIVVDNNCTDRTIEFARRYDFVKVIKEPRQGRGYARSAGFNAAKSEILGRMDADSRLLPDWVERVKKRFEVGNVVGITGLGISTALPYIKKSKTTLWSRNYYWIVHAGFRSITMWGANMAVRKTAWDKVKNDVLDEDRKLHEDQDMSLWISRNVDGIIIQDNKIRIRTHDQSYRYFPKFIRYSRMFAYTKKRHKELGTFSAPHFQKLPISAIAIGCFATIPISIIAFIMTLLFFPVDYWLLKVEKEPEY